MAAPSCYPVEDVDPFKPTSVPDPICKAFIGKIRSESFHSPSVAYAIKGKAAFWGGHIWDSRTWLEVHPLFSFLFFNFLLKRMSET